MIPLWKQQPKIEITVWAEIPISIWKRILPLCTLLSSSLFSIFQCSDSVWLPMCAQKENPYHPPKAIDSWQVKMITDISNYPIINFDLITDIQVLQTLCSGWFYKQPLWLCVLHLMAEHTFKRKLKLDHIIDCEVIDVPLKYYITSYGYARGPSM